MTDRMVIATDLELRAEGLDPLRSVHDQITFSSLDWGAARDTAWIRGIAVGWTCEEDHEHDWICGGDEALAELAARLQWTPQQVARLQALRARWVQLQAGLNSHGGLVADLRAQLAALETENLVLLTRLAFSEANQR